MSGGVSNGESGNGAVEPDDGTGVFGTLAEALAKKPPESEQKVELYRVKPFAGDAVYCWATSVFEAVHRVAFVLGWRARWVNETTGEGA